MTKRKLKTGVISMFGRYNIHWHTTLAANDLDRWLKWQMMFSTDQTGGAFLADSTLSIKTAARLQNLETRLLVEKEEIHD